MLDARPHVEVSQPFDQYQIPNPLHLISLVMVDNLLELRLGVWLNVVPPDDGFA